MHTGAVRIGKLCWIDGEDAVCVQTDDELEWAAVSTSAWSPATAPQNGRWLAGRRALFHWDPQTRSAQRLPTGAAEVVV